MSNVDSNAPAEGARERAYGQGYQASVLDRYGVWLSGRKIRRFAGSLKNRSLGDFGCGYQAKFVRSVLPELQRAVLVDIAISPELRQQEKVQAIEGVLPGVLSQVATESLDLVLCISVLEHLWDPILALKEVFTGNTARRNLPLQCSLLAWEARLGVFRFPTGSKPQR